MDASTARAEESRPGPRAPFAPFVSRRADGILLAGVFVLALLLRVWGVSWSLPYVGHVDEPKIVDSAVHIVKTGDLNPHLFIWPALVIYLQALVYKAQVLWGTWQGLYRGPADLPDQNHIFALAPDLYLWGRTFSALVGASAVAGCYALGRARVGRPAAAVAALLLGTSPLHIEYSHYLVTDVTMGACGLLALAAAWHLATRPGVRPALLAGATVGLCAAAKYNGVYVALPVVTAALLAWRAGRATGAPWARGVRPLGLAAAMLAVAAAVFLAANPYVLLDWKEWSRGFLFQVDAYLPATDLEGVGTAAAKQLAQLWQTDAILLAAGVAGGLVLLLAALGARPRDPARTRAAWLLLPFPPVYLLLMSRFTEVYERNLIVTLPFLCLAAGCGVAILASLAGARWMRVAAPPSAGPAIRPAPGGGRRAAVLALVVGLVLAVEPARRSINFDLYMALPESRNQAAAWLQDELRAGHRAAVELHPWQLCAPPPYPCLAPDVLAPNAPLTEHPPAWYAAHGYDYVLLASHRTDAIVGDPDKEGPRPPDQAAPYAALPVVREWPGDAGGAKGPTVVVLRTSPDPPAPAGLTRSGVPFGAVATLWGYALAPLPTAGATYDPAAGPPPPGPYRPGAAVGVQLAWRALPGALTTPGNWTVALHLLDAAGATVAQVDVLPISSGRLRPVRDWYANEFLQGAYNIPLPTALAPGAYRLTLALYDAPAGRALPVDQPGPAATALDLGAITVGR